MRVKEKRNLSGFNSWAVFDNKERRPSNVERGNPVINDDSNGKREVVWKKTRGQITNCRNYEKLSPRCSLWGTGYGEGGETLGQGDGVK